MPPQQPPLTPSPVIDVQVVTLTVYSTGSSTQSGLPSLSGGGGSSVPIAAIVGGVVGGVALAVLLVIIWKHWGRSIKRTERHRRKEVQDILTVRENTRRNATSGFRPQSQYRPMFTLNPDSRKVTFLTRAPTTALKRASKDNDAAPSSAPAQTEEEEEKIKNSNEGPAPSGDLGSDETRQPSPPSVASPAAALLVHEQVVEAAREPERKSEERRPLEEEVKSTVTAAETMPPRRTSSPTPSGSTSKRPPSPPSTSRDASKRMSRPSRSVRMKTPRRLPDPPSMPAGRDRTRTSSPTPSRTSTSPPSIISSRAHETPAMPIMPPIPHVPPVPPLPVAEPSSPPLRSPLRNSVLPSDQPVIMPRPKNAPSRPSTGDSQPVSPTSTWGHLPSLSGSTSQHSGHSREPLVGQSRFLGSLHRGKPSTGTAGGNQPTTSRQSTGSVYSTD